MARKPTLRAEVDALRAELDALREAKPSLEKPGEKTETGSGNETGDAPRQEELFEEEQPAAADIEKAINEFLHSVKDEVNERPLMAVALAFVLGILIGRLSRS